jgi:hypothetical protein
VLLVALVVPELPGKLINGPNTARKLTANGPVMMNARMDI